MKAVWQKCYRVGIVPKPYKGPLGRVLIDPAVPTAEYEFTVLELMYAVGKWQSITVRPMGKPMRGSAGSTRYPRYSFAAQFGTTPEEAVRLYQSVQAQKLERAQHEVKALTTDIDRFAAWRKEQGF